MPKKNKDNSKKYVITLEGIKEAIEKGTSKDMHLKSTGKGNMFVVEEGGKNRGGVIYPKDADVNQDYMATTEKNKKKLVEHIINSAKEYNQKERKHIFIPVPKIITKTKYVKVPSKPKTISANAQTEEKSDKKKIIAVAGTAFLLGTALGIAGMKVTENKTEGDKIVITVTDRDEKVQLDENSFENESYINENKDLVWNALKGTQADIIVESRINWKTYFRRTKSRNGRKNKCLYGKN